MKKYSIKNIKSFKEESEIEIKPITIFVGKNSCGKSSLIRFPVVISQSVLSDADAPILFFGKNIDYGNFEDVIYGHSKKGKMYFSVSYECNPNRLFFRVSKRNKYLKTFAKSWVVDVRVGLVKYSKRMIVDSCQVFINNNNAINIERVQNEKYNIEFIDILGEMDKISFEAKRPLFSNFIPIINTQLYYDQLVERYINSGEIVSYNNNSIKELKKNVFGKLYGIEDQDEEENEEETDKYVRRIKDVCQMINYYEAIMINVRMQAIQDASDTYYIGPFRENPSRVYRDVEHQVDAVGARGEDVSAMLKNDYTHGKKILTKVSEWFEKSMNYTVSLKDIGSGLYNIVVRKDDGTEDNLIDVGYGISQVLPIVAQLIKISTSPNRHYSSSLIEKNNSLFVIEQPELHLHPEAQAELANLFADMVCQNTENKAMNVLIETHSEHLIRRLQALVADKRSSITNEHVKIYYVDKNDKNEAYVKEMRLQENGQFVEEWPSGFFDKAYELSLELLRNNI